MRLIDADAFERKCLFDENIEDMQDVIYALRDYPTVDAVEVVRCNDCKYWDMVDLHFHKNICSKLMRPCDESDFCSWAERRQDG